MPAKPPPFEKIRLLEPGAVGHGPLWMRYIARALAPLCHEMTIQFPDVPSYTTAIESLVKDPLMGTTDVSPRPIPWADDPKDNLSPRAALELATAPGTDLTFISLLDNLMVNRYIQSTARTSNPFPIWGLWFCPPSFSGENPRKKAYAFQRLLGRRARKHLRTARSLQLNPDWLAGAHFLDSRLASSVSVENTHILPDPWPTRPRHSKEEARRKLDLPLDATLFLHFGVGSPRKGLQDAIAAWKDVPNQACLVRAGVTEPDDLKGLAPLIRTGRACLRNSYVPEEEIDLYLRASDWILIPYRDHSGSSGVMSGAAAAHRPVVAADFGVIGHRVRQAGLGILYTHRSTAALAKAISQAVDTPIEAYRGALDAYTAAQAPEAFADAIRSPLLELDRSA